MSLLDTVIITCPWCGEENELLIDNTVPFQEYIEDCFVCCRPIAVRVEAAADGIPVVTVQRDD